MPNPQNPIPVEDDDDVERDFVRVEHNDEPNPTDEQNRSTKPAGSGGGDNPDVLGDLPDDPEENADDTGRNNVRAADEAARSEVLKRKLVTEYKATKATDAEKDEGITHTTSVANNKKADDAGDYVGYGSTILAATAALGPSILGYGGKIVGEEEFGNEVLEGQLAKDIKSGTAAAGGILGMVSGGIKTGSSLYRAKKDKNRFKRNAAKQKAVSGVFSTIGSTATALSAGSELGLFGGRSTVDGSGEQKAAGVLDIVSGFSGFLANAFEAVGNREEKAGHKTAAAQADALKRSKAGTVDTDLTNSRDVISRYKNRDDLTDEQKNDLKEARQRRHAAKAQKYAMAQAAKLHKTRSEESDKGEIGAIGGAIGFFGSLLTGMSKTSGHADGALGTLGTLFSAAAGVTKTIGAVKDKYNGIKEKKIVKENKRQVVEEYLTSKVERIQQQASEMHFDDDNEEAALGVRGKTISETEAKKIAIMRLGIESVGDGDNISSDAMDKAFVKLTEKRARNILKSNDDDKIEMLTALGLDPDARFEDVVSALSAD